MLILTKQERFVLIFFSFVVFFGSVMRFAFKKYPGLMDIINVSESTKLYPACDVNQASKEELIAIPYIGEYTAKQIIKYRKKNGPFASLEEIKKVKGIREKNYKIFSLYLKI